MNRKDSFPTQPLTTGAARVPVIIQMEALECGAASLTMVLAYYGKWVPLEQVRADCGVSRDGVNAKNILKAARAYGLTAKGYRYELDTLREKGTFPCIIHWNFNHFVVLCGFKGNKAVLNDPAKGTYSVSMEVFDRSFTGVCLMFAPGEEFVPSGKPKSVTAFVRKKLQGTGAAFALVIITTIITSLLGIITPGFSNVFADRLLTGKNPEWFLPFILGISAIAVIQIVVAWIQSTYSLKVNGKIAIIANSEYMWHVLRLPMEFFSQRMAGDIVGRREQNASIAGSIISSFAPLVIQSGMMVFYLFVMLRYSVALSLIGILSVFVNMAASRKISEKRINLTRVSGATVAAVEMIESIKASGAENGFFERWSGYQASVNAGSVQMARMNATLGLLPQIVSMLTNTLVLMGSVYLCQQGEWTVGMITVFSGFLSPAMRLVSVSQTLQEMRTGMERIEDVMEYPTAVPYTTTVSPDETYDKLSGKIELKNVTFGYSKLSEPLIRDFSMTRWSRGSGFPVPSAISGSRHGTPWRKF